MARIGMLFSVIVYFIFFGTFLYLVGFLGNSPGLPRTIDIGPETTTVAAIAINLSLLLLFGIQHSVMARPAFKAKWTQIVPPHIERTIYVLASSIVLMLLFYFWRPMPSLLWLVTWPPAVWLLWGLFALGWGIVLLSTFLLNHFELFGLAQTYLKMRGQQSVPPKFRTPLLYRAVRHPLYLGFLLAFWSTPMMTVGHFFFATGMTIYIFIAIHHEERDLIGEFGAQYEEYRRRVGKLFPGIR